MSLPKIDLPTFELTLPSNNKKIRFRPFLVKEEKILLMAMESEKEKDIMDATKQIINNCSLDPINVDDMPLFDVEYFFLNLRARSVNEIIEARYKCNNIVTDKDEQKECSNILKLDINLLEISIPKNPNHSSKISLSKDIGVQMRYPKMSLLESNQSINNVSSIEYAFNYIADCIEYIYDKETVYYSKDVDKKEIITFIESLTSDQFKKIEEFFDTIPKLEKTFDIKCEKCGFDHKIVMEGLQSFFG